jgi:hypothetical protein
MCGGLGHCFSDRCSSRSSVTPSKLMTPSRIESPSAKTSGRQGRMLIASMLVAVGPSGLAAAVRASKRRSSDCHGCAVRHRSSQLRPDLRSTEDASMIEQPLAWRQYCSTYGAFTTTYWMSEPTYVGWYQADPH